MPDIPGQQAFPARTSCQAKGSPQPPAGGEEEEERALANVGEALVLQHERDLRHVVPHTPGQGTPAALSGLPAAAAAAARWLCRHQRERGPPPHTGHTTQQTLAAIKTAGPAASKQPQAHTQQSQTETALCHD